MPTSYGQNQANVLVSFSQSLLVMGAGARCVACLNRHKEYVNIPHVRVMRSGHEKSLVPSIVTGPSLFFVTSKVRSLVSFVAMGNEPLLIIFYRVCVVFRYLPLGYRTNEYCESNSPKGTDHISAAELWVRLARPERPHVAMSKLLKGAFQIYING